MAETGLAVIPYEDLEGRMKEDADKYLAQRAAYPDEGSEFDIEMGDLKYVIRQLIADDMPLGRVIESLMKRGYDALLAYHEDEIQGHIAFQVHDDEARSFSTEIDPEFFSKNFIVEGLNLWYSLIGYARSKGMNTIKFSDGNNRWARTAYEFLSGRSQERNIKILGDYTVEVLQA